MADQALISY